MKANRTLVVVGSANMDMVVTTDRFPKSGETVLGKEFFMVPGGKGANQAVCSAKLGGNVLFIGKMGDDIFRDRLMQSMGDDGVYLEHVFIDRDHSTGIALIMVENAGNNEIVVVSGSNMHLTPADIESKEAIIASADVVLMQLEIPVATVRRTAEIAKANDATVILNPAPACQLPPDLLQLIDYLTPNEVEIELLTGIKIIDNVSLESAARSLIDRGVRNVIATLGKKGSMCLNGDGIRYFEARTAEAVDTTAAGDAFNGAFALGLLHKMDKYNAIEFASTVAALSVTKAGAQSSMPTVDDLAVFDGAFAEMLK
jgi:ribokinase